MVASSFSNTGSSSGGLRAAHVLLLSGLAIGVWSWNLRVGGLVAVSSCDSIFTSLKLFNKFITTIRLMLTE